MKTLPIRILAIAAALWALSAAGCAAEEDAVPPTPTASSATATPAPAPTASAKATERESETPAPASASESAVESPAASETTASSSERTPSDEGDVRTLDADNLEIVTLLGYDAIRAILEPEFVDAEQADEWLEDDALVIGVSINGDSRAYTVPMLSVHEIVNDVVGGEPVAVTW